ncbi:putative transcription factor C2H2 family [Medicago truncatula]|uniref:RING-type E3 ubiquitin transferase n=1 Tax=Medicago truncatula TaxID=3880 RepID=A0A072VA08_MEDTR|nr:E3 ubiquitin-protein ligase RNF12 [Medicago truncatula]KEH38657.1 zinc finger, C3HC4 type (RING finger) protein [Medicago truncatula]RHN75016.1 putative transcription factor C2H2 family [Medicago truncatula]
MISEEALVLMDDGRGPHTRSTLASSYIAHSNVRHIGGVAMRDNTSVLPFCFPSLNQVGQHNNIGSRLGQSNHNHLINANNMRQSFLPIPYIQAPNANGSSLQRYHHDTIGNLNDTLYSSPPRPTLQHNNYNPPTFATNEVPPNPLPGVVIAPQTGLQILQPHGVIPEITLRNRSVNPSSFIFIDESDLIDEDENLVDEHQDMRLDIDNMSYEELVALGERIGNVSTSLPEKTIESQLKTKLYSPYDSQEIDACMICQEEFKIQEKIGILQCKHGYHVDCIIKWLMIKNICPICKLEALTDGEKNKSHGIYDFFMHAYHFIRACFLPE